MSPAVKVILTVILWLPGEKPIIVDQPVENISICFGMAREYVAQAENSPTVKAKGARFDVGCSVIIPKTVDH